MDEVRELAGRLAGRLTGVGGVVGVVLGGSRARGAHRPDSDLDLGLYYRPPLDVAALRALAAELSDTPAEPTEPGGWGPWVDGGAWLTVGGLPVDWIYRAVDRVALARSEALAGRYEVGWQPGHPLGFHSHAYIGELVTGLVLADPSGELAALRAGLDPYPRALRDALVERARWLAPFVLGGARKGAKGGDAAYVAGCVFQAAGLLAHALHADAGRWLLNEKGAVPESAGLRNAPYRFGERVARIAGSLGTTPAELAASVEAMERLADEVISRLVD